MQKIEVIGNICKQPEMKSDSSGKPLLRFSLGARSKRNEEETSWYSCTLFGSHAERLAPHLAAGSKVYVRGDLRAEAVDKDGKVYLNLYVSVSELEFAGSKKDQPSNGTPDW